MYCPKCGAENPGDSLFCNKCGNNLSSDSYKKNNVLTEMIGKFRPLINKKNILALCLVLVIILAVAFYLNNPVSKFKSYIRNNNYIEANNLYYDKIKGKTDKEKQIISFLRDEIIKIKKSFTDERMNYKDAKKRLETIRNTCLINSDTNEVIDFVNNLNNSRSAYKKAEEHLKNNDIVNALKEYKKVIEDDKNFAKAQEQISNNEKKYKERVLKLAKDSANVKDYDKSIKLLKEAKSVLPDDSDINAKLSVYESQLQEKLIAEQLVVVESAKITVQDATYKSIYPDMIQVIVKNTSDKTIKEMKVGCLGYDKNGYPLKIKPHFDFSGGGYEFVGNASDVNIVAGGRFGQDVGWELDTSHGISKVLACIKSATFYDGTAWENPYYETWIEQYKEKPLN